MTAIVSNIASNTATTTPTDTPAVWALDSLMAGGKDTVGEREAIGEREEAIGEREAIGMGLYDVTDGRGEVISGIILLGDCP